MVTALVCKICNRVVGCRNVDNAEDYICHACQRDLELVWAEPLLSLADQQGLFNYPGLDMCEVTQLCLAAGWEEHRLIFAADTLLFALVGVVQGALTPGDAVALRNDLAARCGLLPTELLQQIVTQSSQFQPWEIPVTQRLGELP